MNAEANDSGLSSSTIAALAAMGVAIFLIANDFTALSVTLSSIESDFDTTLSRAQWVINAYTVVFGVLIVTGGRLADVFGRKRIFLIGATIFATFSLMGGLSPNIWVLIAARALMGVGGALMWPSILGLTYSILPEEKAGLAGGLITGVAGLGNAMGPLVAGALTDAVSWRWVFFVNVPITVVAMLVTGRFVGEADRVDEARLDYKGIATLSAGVILTLGALDQGTSAGFGDPVIIGMFIIGALLLVSFAFVERAGGSSALVPREIVANHQFSSAALVVLLVSAIYFGMLVYVPQYTQQSLGWSALQAGAGLLPVMVTFAIVSFIAGPLYNRVGARLTVGSGAAFLTGGIFWLAIAMGDDYSSLVPGLIITGIGIGLFFSGVTTAAVTSLDPSQTSLGGGIIYMANVAGGALGLGLNTAIVLAASDLSDGITTAFVVDGVLGAAGTILAFSLIEGAGTVHSPQLRLHHRAHG